MTTTTYLYDGLKLLEMRALENNTTETILTYFYTENEMPFAFYFSQRNGEAETTATILLTTNSRGDILLLSDEKGNPIARYGYDPYGNITGTQITTTTILPSLAFNTSLAQTQPLRYASYFYDSSVNLYYLSQRYYDPETYEFISKDPAKADGEESSYQYCGGDSINFTDPSGEHSTFVRHRHTWYGWYGKGYSWFVRYVLSCHSFSRLMLINGFFYLGVKRWIADSVSFVWSIAALVARRSVLFWYLSFAVSTYMGWPAWSERSYVVYKIYYRAYVKPKFYQYKLLKCH